MAISTIKGIKQNIETTIPELQREIKKRITTLRDDLASAEAELDWTERILRASGNGNGTAGEPEERGVMDQ
jgi:hypothetical protein